MVVTRRDKKGHVAEAVAVGRSEGRPESHGGGTGPACVTGQRRGSGTEGLGLVAKCIGGGPSPSWDPLAS